ncbi:hypothetical protein EST38_g11801 [Candolleomyces aberdarensis]|uniref:Uncharacterized protein n=1 Tax=Candolleomyces aberdarensis TaxID=2316362 RepID=A0A4Q2D400_9AGAR|nr:hypothetical protein EST38_g11801 [Candolleomyces aberdarensis]
MKFLSAISLLVAPLVSWALVIPNADTPSFYFVATSPHSSTPRPVLIGPDGVYTTLAGSGTAIQAYFYQGYLTGTLDKSGSPTYRPLVDTGFNSDGSCATYGQFGYSAHGSTNKCASFPRLQIQSNNENSQLGAKLTYNYVGGFYVCGTDEMIWYKRNAEDGPQACSPVDLYTVPVL